jgi:ribonucleoside-diphosphate reductase alpha chain
LLSDDIKEKYASPYNIPYEVMIDANAARQVYVDQAQSFNLFSKTQSLKYHNDMFMYAWEAGCKTTYYLRSKAATQIKTLEEKVQEHPKLTAEAIAEDQALMNIHPFVYAPNELTNEQITDALRPLIALETEVMRQSIQANADRIWGDEEKRACSIANPESCEACQS